MADEMKGRICLITGATSGIGKATATALARMGATVVYPARNLEKAKATKESIVSSSGNESVDFMECDLSSMDQVHGFCVKFQEKYSSLHVLVNNAGTWEGERKLSKDGFENTFAVNHLAPFLMTNMLLGAIKRSAPARIISLSSGLHGGTIDFEDVEFERRFRPMAAYRQSKLADLLFIKELSRRLAGSGVTANAVMPGFVATGLGRNSSVVSRAFFRMFGASPDKGARTSIYLASSPDVADISGECFSKCRVARTSRQSNDPALAKRLWDLSEEYTQRWLGSL